MSEPALVTVAEAARRLGVPRKTLNNRLAKGQAPELRAIRLWGRWRVPVDAIRELAAGAPAPDGAAAMLRRVDYPHLRARSRPEDRIAPAARGPGPGLRAGAGAWLAAQCCGGGDDGPGDAPG